ncbi:MAG TPA: T9SS type A sorting domain-containing protein [Ignavibacteria bacterium]|nr:T9SS type A sorting domain-containing protein [Ignavibacteria bacterium]HQY51195.1 T9SS type A sorting domain-containing protein [Ignavibacteria bacterium]HRA99659.1 T9SS type A sorting domain-containing protein [Ignavibacteria bacterium]
MKASTKIFLALIFYTSLSTFFFQNSFAQLVSDFHVNEDSTSYSQYAAKVGSDQNGNFVIVWYDSRTSENPRISAQRYNQKAQKIGNNFQINNDQYQAFPSLHVRENGSFIVAWSVVQTKFKIFNSSGLPITNEIIISDSSGMISSIGGDSYGNFVIVWEQYNSALKYQIYCQLIDSSGKLIGSKIKVNDDNLDIHHKNPDITIRNDGSFIVTWQDSRPPSVQNSEDIYMQMFSKKGTPIGNNIKVSDDTVRYNKQSEAKISSDTSGRFCISFTEFILNEVQSNIVCQLYHPDGSRQGNNFNIAGSIISEFGGVIFKKENGDMVSGYSYYSNRYEPYFQRINSQGNLTGNGYLVSTEFSFADKYFNDIAVWDDRIISVWQDKRNGNYDIYCNIRSYSNPDSTVNIQNISTEIPNEFKLFQNYPNPFNNTTQIRFDIYTNDQYSMSVYNNLGQKIKEIFKNYLSPGTYKISFESGELSSGVYHYILSSPNKIRKKRLVKSFVLIK